MACYLCKGCFPKCGSKLLEVYPEDDNGCEEKCCPSFWYDAGVPQLPILSWVFDPQNAWLNNNKAMDRFGAIGYHYCDARRKRFMGTALAFTVVAVVFATWGVMGLTTDLDTLRYTAWGTAYIKNTTDTTATKYYLGLRTLVVDKCYDATGGKSRSWDCSLVSATDWEDLSEDIADEVGFSWAAVQECKAQAVGIQVGAFSTTVTILFALNGCLTRIRRQADSNFQKLLGCLPDMWGVASLGASLVQFSVGCYFHMPDEVRGAPVSYYIGPAFGSYAFVLGCGALRCLLHWLTPVPGKGCSNQCCDVKSQSWSSIQICPEPGEQASSSPLEEVAVSKDSPVKATDRGLVDPSFVTSSTSSLPELRQRTEPKRDI